MKRVSYGTSNSDYAIIVGNRLPTPAAGSSAPELHTAVLVSLEMRDDLYPAPKPAAPATQDANDAQSLIPILPIPQQPLPFIEVQKTLIVLHSWSFTPVDGGDFQQVMTEIHIQPNGGVLRFGSEPWAADPSDKPLSGGFKPLLDGDGYLLGAVPADTPGPVKLRGPLCPSRSSSPAPTR